MRHAGLLLLLAVLAACEPSLLVVERPPLPEGTVAAAIVAVGVSGVLVRADEADTVRIESPLDAEVQVYAYGAALAGVRIPDGGAELTLGTGCAPHALPPASWRWSVRGGVISTTVAQRPLIAESVDCLPGERAYVAAPSDAQGVTCRALVVEHGACTIGIVETASVCTGEITDVTPTWGLRLDGSACDAPIESTCVRDGEARAPVELSARCGEAPDFGRFGLLRTTPLAARVETVTIAAAVPFVDDGREHRARVGAAMETGALVDFVASGDHWVVFGVDGARSPFSCRWQDGTPVYRVDRRTLAVTVEARDPHGCLRAPLELADGGYLAAFRTTLSSTHAATLGLVRFDASGQAVAEAPIPSSKALERRAPQTLSGTDTRLVTALVDITTAGGPPRALAVVSGWCPDTGYNCSFLHVFDPLTLAPIATQEQPSATLPRTAYRDGDELVLLYDSPDVMEIHPLPLVFDGPKRLLGAMERAGGSTASFASRGGGFWLVGSTHFRGIFGGIRYHTLGGSSLMLLGANTLANPFGIGAIGPRVFAFFTLGGEQRRTWMTEIPVGRDPPAVLATSLELDRGVVGRVRTDALGQMWALVPERGVIMRITVP